METLKWINYVISILFFVCYFYQCVYIPIVWLFKNHKPKKQIKIKLNRYAVLICARNEQEVIADLINSIHSQTYPDKLIDIFVMADNCDDNTAQIAKSHGAIVYQRFNKVEVGKGYALKVLMDKIARDYPNKYDGYFVFDADNILEKNYIEKMNESFNQGNQIVTSYRNTKNYGVNWISAGYGLWFLRESRYLNNAREILHSSCAVSGTGFMFSQAIAQEINGWPYHCLTEDIEFSIDQIIKEKRIAFCKEAVLYDEQPVSFVQSVHQRMRWSKGYYQVLQLHGWDLLKGMFKGNFACFDMMMNIAPAFILSAISLVCNSIILIKSFATFTNLAEVMFSTAQFVLSMYLMLYVIGLITTVTEWNYINTTGFKKIIYTFTFPVFMFTYLPISILALFCKTTWKPIKHSFSVNRMNKEGISLSKK
ncbi:MAG: glycosyltransferase family 2 protein [Erysipelotrichaceae bacterium]